MGLALGRMADRAVLALAVVLELVLGLVGQNELRVAVFPPMRLSQPQRTRAFP